MKYEITDYCLYIVHVGIIVGGVVGGVFFILIIISCCICCSRLCARLQCDGATEVANTASTAYATAVVMELTTVKLKEPKN